MRHKGMTFCKLFVLLVLALLLTGCAQQPQAPFDGVIATSDVVFNLDFTALNTTYTSTVFPLSHKSSVTSPPSLNTGKFRPIRFSGYSDSSFL